MAVHDIRSNFKMTALFAGGTKTAATLNTLPVDLSVGTTAMFWVNIYGDTVLAGQNISAITIQYADDLAFTENVVNEPVDGDGISELGNSVYTVAFPNQSAGEKAQLLIPLLPFDYSNSDILSFVANVVNPFNSPVFGSKTRYCRLQLGFAVNTNPQRITGSAFVGPIRKTISN